MQQAAMYVCTSACSIYPSPPGPPPTPRHLSPSRFPCLSLTLSHTHSCTRSQLCTHLYTHTNGVCDVDRALCILTTSHSAYWLHHTLRTDISIHVRQPVRRVLCLHHINQPCPCIHQWVMSLFTSKRISVYMTYESDASVYRSISPYTLRQCMCMTWSVHTWDMTHSYHENDFLICVTPLFQQWVRGVQATLHPEAIQGEVTPGRHSQKSARYSVYWINSL